MGTLGSLPWPFGAKHQNLTIRFTTIRRFAFFRENNQVKLDKDGYPIEDVNQKDKLIPPQRANLVRYHGVFAPNSRLRPHVLPRLERVAGVPAPGRARGADGAPGGCGLSRSDRRLS